MPVTPTSSAVRPKCNTVAEKVTTYDVGPTGPVLQALGLDVLKGEK